MFSHTKQNEQYKTISCFPMALMTSVVCLNSDLTAIAKKKNPSLPAILYGNTGIFLYCNHTWSIWICHINTPAPFVPFLKLN